MGAIAGAVTSLKTASDIVKVLSDLKDASAFQSKLIDLQREIMSAQTSALAANSDQFALLDKVRKLERHVDDLEAWSQEKSRYELKDFGCGTFAYALKQGMELGEPFHRICPTCYQQGRKSILQSLWAADGRENVSCAFCKSETILGCDRQDWKTARPVEFEPF